LAGIGTPGTPKDSLERNVGLTLIKLQPETDVIVVDHCALQPIDN